jgi:hypothetical protein
MLLFCCEGFARVRYRLSPHAVIDVGSNTIHLLVGEVEDGAVLPVTREKVSARLGAGVDKTGRIEEARIPVAVEAIGLFDLQLSDTVNAWELNADGTHDRVEPQEDEEPLDSQALLLDEPF